MKIKYLLVSSTLALSFLSCAALADNQTTVLSLDGNVIGQVPPSPYVSDHPAADINGVKYTYYGALKSDFETFMTHYTRIRQTEDELPALVPGQQYNVMIGMGYMTKNNEGTTMCTSTDCTENGNQDYHVQTLSDNYNLTVKYLGECVGGAPDYAHTKLWEIINNSPLINTNPSGTIDSLKLKEGEYPSESNPVYPTGTCQATTDGYIKSTNGTPITACGVAQKQVSGIYVWTQGNCSTQPEVIGINRS